MQYLRRLAKMNHHTSAATQVHATILKKSRSYDRCLSLTAVCWLSLLSPLGAQTGKELVATACYNEHHQREQNALWESRLQRRTGGHIYLEEEIETVDGSIHRLLSVDGHEPSPSDRKQDDDRLRELMQNPRARLALKKNRQADERKFDDLLRVLPEAFLFEDQGKRGDMEKLVFRPNPAFNPNNYEERGLHAMTGMVFVDIQEKRLAQFSGTLTKQVDFGLGLIGHLGKGGTIQVSRVRLSPGLWKTSFTRIDLDGRFVLFKTFSKQQDETHSDFKPLPSDTSIEQALRKLVSKF
jgi:hypothetical protein